MIDALNRLLTVTDANGCVTVDSILVDGPGTGIEKELQAGIDRIGVKRATMLFGVLCWIGAVITVATSNFYVMAAGRLVFGLGAESLIVSVTTALAKWFKGKELSFAFGVNLTIARLGSYLALRSPSWAHFAYDEWRLPLLIAVGMGTFCIIGPLIYWIMENSAGKRFQLGKAGETDKVTFSELFGLGPFRRAYGRNYAVHPDGQEFVMVGNPETRVVWRVNALVERR